MSMPQVAPAPYSYAVLRAVPRVDREEFLNIGVVLYCQALGYLDVAFELQDARLLAVFPRINLDDLRADLTAFELTCRGIAGAGPMAGLPHSQRFHWLTAVRSTVLQASPLHCGVTTDPAATLARLMERMVR